MTRVTNPQFEQSYKCYLIATIDPETMKVLGVSTHSEPPWYMTRMGGSDRNVMAVVLERSGSSFAEALQAVEVMYPIYEKDLAARFPLPGYEPETNVTGISTAGVTTGRQRTLFTKHKPKKRGS